MKTSTVEQMDLTIIVVEDLTKADGIELLHIWGRNVGIVAIEGVVGDRRILEVL